MAEIYEFKKAEKSWRGKFNEAMYNTTNKVKAGVNWAINNPEKTAAIIATGATIFGGARKGYKFIHSHVENYHAEREMYCGTVNRKVRLKHALTDKDIKELAELMSNGMTRYDALNKMNLIK